MIRDAFIIACALGLLLLLRIVGKWLGQSSDMDDQDERVDEAEGRG